MISDKNSLRLRVNRRLIGLIEIQETGVVNSPMVIWPISRIKKTYQAE